jgi:hypothetical protein
MFIIPPDNFNQNPMWNPTSMFSEYPMMPMPDFDMQDDERQNPMPQAPPLVPGDNQEFEIPPTSPIVNNPLYNQGWLTTQIGKYIKIEFLIGTSMLIDREGILKEVGISFIVIQEAGTNDMLMCDIYSVKFVRVFDPQPKKCIP